MITNQYYCRNEYVDPNSDCLSVTFLTRETTGFVGNTEHLYFSVHCFKFMFNIIQIYGYQH